MGSKDITTGQEERDNELIASYRKTGGTFFVGELYERYTHLVFAVCMKYLKDEAESHDAVMDIFEKLLHELKYRQIDVFKAWIYTVTKNYCLQKIRKRGIHERVHKKLSGEDHFGSISTQEDFRKYSEEEEKYKELESAIDELKDEQRTCIRLMYLEDKSYKEIAEITNFDLNQVKSFIQNGKRNLKQILEKKEMFKNGE